VPASTPISFRPDPDLLLRLEQLRATFPKQQWKEVFTWIFECPEVRTRIRERVSS
jgi:hypothetical protein